MDRKSDPREAALGRAMAMITEVEKTAAFGAHLRALTEPIEVPDDVAEGLHGVAEAVLPGVSELQPETLAGLRAALLAFFRQAYALLEDPGREPGWRTDDAALLQAQGRASAAVADVLHEVAPRLEGLPERLAAGGAFCDVGTGVGWLAIAAARHWPEARIVGVDVSSAPLELAADNLAAAALSERIELVRCDVCDLEGRDFDLVWLPGPFLPRHVVPKALAAIHHALRPGGWIAFGIYGGQTESVAHALDVLRTIRSGGHPWTVDELIGILSRAGFQQVAEVPKRWDVPIALVVGRKSG